MDAITIGCDWSLVVNVTPAAGRDSGNVTADMTGAAGYAGLFDGPTLLVEPSVAIDADTRKATLTIPAAKTRQMKAGKQRRIGLRITCTDARVLAIDVPGFVEVRVF